MLCLAVFLFSLNARAESPEAAWNSQPGFSEAEVRVIPSLTNFARSVPLTVLRLKNSNWSEKEAIERIRRTEEVYSQCQVSFRPITLVAATRAAGAVIDVDQAENFLNWKNLLDRQALEKPLVILLDRALNGDYEGGFSMRNGVVGAESPAVNVAVLLSAYAKDASRSYPFSLPAVEGKYEVMAHELGHLLFDEPHLPGEGNLMNNLAERTNTIEAWQCGLIGAPPKDPGRSQPTF